jgi:hypothetical protein
VVGTEAAGVDLLPGPAGELARVGGQCGSRLAGVGSDNGVDVAAAMVKRISAILE